MSYSTAFRSGFFSLLFNDSNFSIAQSLGPGNQGNSASQAEGVENTGAPPPTAESNHLPQL